MNAHAKTSKAASETKRAAESLLAPDSTTQAVASDITVDRRSTNAVDILRTWRLAREIVAYNPNHLFVVAPQAHEPAGLRIIRPDRSVDLLLSFDGSVWMHRPWKQLLDARATTMRSLGTTRLVAARIVKTAHIYVADASPDATATTHAIAGVVDFLETRPRGDVINAQGWVRDGGGLRLDGPRGCRWLQGVVPIDAHDVGPLPELPASAWFWLALEGGRRVTAWWSQRPIVPAGDEPPMSDVTSPRGHEPATGTSARTQGAEPTVAA
jgi:hypothetical protein